MNLEDHIQEAEAPELAVILGVAIERLGQLGRDGREALDDQLENIGENVDVEEGLGQLSDLEALKPFIG